MLLDAKLLIGSGLFCLILTHCWWFMLIDADLCWIILIDADWFWLILLDSDFSWFIQDSCKSPGTCPFWRKKVASPVASPNSKLSSVHSIIREATQLINSQLSKICFQSWWIIFQKKRSSWPQSGDPSSLIIRKTLFQLPPSIFSFLLL